jgi:NADPH:quinone reductase-like Zn-dependent oxidoreductase
MPQKNNFKADLMEPAAYQIRLKGHLSVEWRDWFDDLSITLEDNGDTLLSGPLIDQAALHGVLKRVRDLGMPLLSINRLKPTAEDPVDFKQTIETKPPQNLSIFKKFLSSTQISSGGVFMKAIIFTQYGSPDVLQLKEIEKPVPGDNEILVKVHAASANPADWHTMRAEPFLARTANGLLKPRVPRLGADLAGRVEAVGKNVTEFKPGDDVFGELPLDGLGSFAEYVCSTEDALALKPAGLTFEQAASVPLAGFTALQGLRNKGKIQAGQKVLINGASGGIGTFAVQIAKSYGTEVTGVTSTRNLDLVRSIGADHVIDYTREDITKKDQKYDLIFDTVGNLAIAGCKRILTPNGICSVAGFTTMSHLFGVMLFGGKQVGMMETASSNKKDLLFLKELLDTGKMVPVIDKQFLLSETAEAIRYLETGRARGKVVIKVV